MSNNSKILALKYRPQIFNELIGQKVIAESIFNSIKNNKIPNAYMFLGIRGSGKTSTARIQKLPRKGRDRAAFVLFDKRAKALRAFRDGFVLIPDGQRSGDVGGARYVGSQFAAEDNIYQIDGAMTVDLGLTYRQGPALLRFNLKNITSNKFETRGFGATSVIPAAPLTFKTTLGYSL